MVKKNYDNMLSRFHLILERHGQTDRQTDGRTDGHTMSDRQICYISISCVRQFSMTVNDPQRTFNVTPIINAEYVSNGTR